ncbi:MAG: iron-sulfur cluster assembly scaffold protein [Alphaproteobacteria bacterium]
MNEDIYQAAIVEAARRGAEDRRLAAPDRSATADNPLCGDRVTIDVALNDGRIAALGYRARGCALCQAATAYLAEAALGKTPAEAASLAGEAQKAVTPEAAPAAAPWNVFAPVRAHPSRRDCVTLAFEALKCALG